MEFFVARQPVLDRHLALYGYELLFREGPENLFPGFDDDYASSRVIYDTAFVFGRESLSTGAHVFINIPRRVLLAELFSILPSDCTVIELLETVEPEAEVIDACKALKKAGYLLALDDFLASPGYEPLIELADFLKVDFVSSGPQERQELAERYRSQVHLVAEKVETLALYSDTSGHIPTTTKKYRKQA